MQNLQNKNNRQQNRRNSGREQHNQHSQFSQPNRPAPDKNEAQYENQGLVFGRNAVMEALKAGRQCDTLYVLGGAKGLGAHISIAKEGGAVVKDVGEQKLSTLTGGAHHGGIAGFFSEADGGTYVELSEILEVSKQKGTAPFIIIADEIEDPHNLGALIRTAEAAGADGLVIPKRRSAALSATVYNTSAGAANWLKIARVPNLVDAIKTLQKNNIWVYGAEADGDSFYDVDFSGGVCLVIGSEGKGLGRLVREHCDKIVSIDMLGHVNSLNASVSGGILMYEIVRSRRSG